MKLLKTANNKSVIRFSVKDWYEIGVTAGWLPNVTKREFYEFLKERGYSQSSGKGHVDKWVCPGRRPITFTEMSQGSPTLKRWGGIATTYVV